jgi:outer membrane lipoprotein-sorting protein
MRRRFSQFALAAFAITPMVVLSAQESKTAQEPTCEQVFKNIQVFKGVPASDLIPSMEFMSASLKFECSECHNPKDFSAETRGKETARRMVLMQRDINAKNFNGRNEVTCNSCHGGKEHPAGTPIPDGITMRHTRIDNAPKPEDLFSKHVAAAGKVSGMLTRTGTLTAPNDATHKVETTPLEFIQADGGKFRMVSGDRRTGSDGKQTWYGSNPMFDEPANIFGRLGRAWRGDDAFAGLEKTAVSGKDSIGKAQVMVVRGARPSTTSTEELYFDAKSNLLSRLVNVRRSSLGSVVTALDYSNYKSVNGAKVPMKVVATFADGTQWTMDFKSAKIDGKVDDSLFVMGSK